MRSSYTSKNIRNIFKAELFFKQKPQITHFVSVFVKPLTRITKFITFNFIGKRFNQLKQRCFCLSTSTSLTRFGLFSKSLGKNHVSTIVLFYKNYIWPETIFREYVVIGP